MPQLYPHQADLLERTRDAYRRGYKHPCIVLGCGGGKSCIVATIARGAVEKGGHVLFLVHRQELCAQIQATFASWGVNLSSCDIMMVQTASRHVDKLTRPSLIITDENHHALAASYRRIYDAFPDVPTVGVTATPCRLNGGGLGDVNDVLVEGMPTRWLIDNGYLADYDYYAPSVTDLTGLRTSHGEYVASDIERLLSRPAIYGDVIRYYNDLAPGRAAIVYCASIRHSQAVAAAFSDAGIPAAHIDGDTPSGVRYDTVSRFRDGSIRVLCNVDLISEGFDVPDCAASILLRPTKSLTLYIQQSMRCMRPLPGKRAVIIDHVGNYARFGLPDAPREWSLTPQKQKAAAPAMRTCPECLRVFPPSPSLTECPYCGEELPTKPRTVKEVSDAELTKIEGFVVHYDTPGQCTSYEELRAYGRKKGYKPGWSYYQAKQRGFVV